MSQPRVLCYSPYNRWALHGRWEMTVLHALRVRGAHVDYVLCDGLFSDCDVFWAATDPRPANACQLCQAQVTNLALQLGMDYRWLGRHIRPSEQATAREWAAGLATAELPTARYGDWDVATWVTGSVHSHLRRSTLDPADPQVEAAFRSYLYSGLVACFALDRLLEESAPDVLFLFNGRQSSTRVALELAMRRGIRVVCHERGTRKETLSLTVDASCLTLEPLQRAGREWADVPLTGEELATIDEHFREREQGTGMSWSALTAAPQAPHAVRGALGLEPGRELWALFTSSDDEVTSEDEWAGGFADQMDWIERTIAHAARRDDLDLVIRVHPNTGSRRSTGANRAQLEQMQALAQRLPANVRMVMPEEELSSYTLMDLADVGLVYHSTVALEMAAKGKEVVVAGGNLVAGTSFVRTATGADTYDALLDGLGDADPAAIRRAAHRFAHTYFFRASAIPFPLVRMPTPLEGEVAWRSLDDLLPGRDIGVDHVARVVLEGEPVCPPPTAAERARTTHAEDAFLAAPARRLTALAYAAELIADDGLLRAWGATFAGRDDVTLVIHTPAEETDRLVEVVSRAGLDGEDGPDLVAVEAGDPALTAVDAVFSRRAPVGALATAPRYDDTTLSELAA
jgi:hypothetical protein